jgi:hypothetical protein
MNCVGQWFRADCYQGDYGLDPLFADWHVLGALLKNAKVDSTAIGPSDEARLEKACKERLRFVTYNAVDCFNLIAVFGAGAVLLSDWLKYIECASFLGSRQR